MNRNDIVSAIKVIKAECSKHWGTAPGCGNCCFSINNIINV